MGGRDAQSEEGAQKPEAPLCRACKRTARQLVHDAAPPVLYRPAAQLKHSALDVLPVEGLYLPAAQFVHDGAPAALKVPAEQETQAAAAAAL